MRTTDSIDGARERPVNGRIAFVTGASGFLGANLVRELFDRGWTTCGLVRETSDRSWLAGLDFHPAIGDLTDPASLRAAIPEGADAVFHLAADLRLSDRATEAQIETNVQGTRDLLRAAHARSVRKVVLSSSMAAFGLHSARIDEQTSSNALDVPVGYFQSKYRAEIEAERAIDGGLDATIVNPANIVGPFDSHNLIATLIGLVARSLLPISAPGRMTFCHARAVSAAMVNAVDRGRTGERYLLGGAEGRLDDLFRIVVELTGGTLPRGRLPTFRSLDDARRVSRIAERYDLRFLTPEIAYVASHDMLVDDSKALRDLHYAPATMRQMTCDSVNWLRDRGYL